MAFEPARNLLQCPNLDKMRSFLHGEKSRFAIFASFLCIRRESHSVYVVVQEFRADLQAAETKDKKFVKRKTVLKKIVANITMGNDSWLCQFRLRSGLSRAPSVPTIHGCGSMFGNSVT